MYQKRLKKMNGKNQNEEFTDDRWKKKGETKIVLRVEDFSVRW